MGSPVGMIRYSSKGYFGGRVWGERSKDCDLVLISLLLGSENVWCGSLGTSQDDMAVSMKIGDVIPIPHRILTRTAERSF